MEKIMYQNYNKKEMINIIKKEAFLFVETNYNNYYIIRKKDLEDFIILETKRKGHDIRMKFYMPGIDYTVITTMGWFLDKANPLLREEIIERLILLQTTDEQPKNVKVFDLEIFYKLNDKEKGIVCGKIKNFDKLYGKYALSQEKYNMEMKGVKYYGC